VIHHAYPDTLTKNNDYKRIFLEVNKNFQYFSLLEASIVVSIPFGNPYEKFHNPS